MDRRSLLLGVAVWLTVVLVVSGATWAVIDAAGRDVTTRPASDPAAAGVPASTAPAPPTTAATRRASRVPEPQSSRPADTRRSTPSSAPTVAPTASTTAAPTPTRTPSARVTTAPTPRPSTRTPRPAPAPKVRTWAGNAGSVTARCTGARVGLVSATPADGWRMEVSERGPERVQVELHRASSDDSEHESEDGEDSVEVRAECAGGIPRFRVQT